MGKGSINEKLTYGGVYQGAGSHPDVKAVVEKSDAILWIGRFASDFNTGEFTMNVDESKIIDLQRFWITIGGKRTDLKMKQLLKALVEAVKKTPLSEKAGVTWEPYGSAVSTKSGDLSQAFLWPTLGQFFREGDLIISETGTSGFGIADSKLPKNTYLWNQTIFGSIGYATGAAVGAFSAIKEDTPFKRGVLVTGDGSLQLTAQAFADMLKWDLKPIMYAPLAFLPLYSCLLTSS
jgi:pyruvate decarboxylase